MAFLFLLFFIINELKEETINSSSYSIFLGTIIFILVISLILYTTKSKNNNKNKLKKPPQPPGSWPIIGHLHLLANPKTTMLPHETLGALADSLGPAFTVRLGAREALVVSDRNAAADCLGANDKLFLTRPRSLAVQIMGYDHAMLGMAPYGPYWRYIRKLAVTELLSARRLHGALGRGIDAEVHRFVAELKGAAEGGAAVEMCERFGDLAMGVSVRAMAGERCCARRGGRRAFAGFLRLMGAFLASDFVPFVGWLVDVLVRGRRYKAEMVATASELDYVLSEWVEEHRSRGVREEDFVDVMLGLVDADGRIFGRDGDTVIKATCLSLMLGGNDTTMVTLTWALSLLLNNRHALQRVQDELDVHVGRQRQVEESDLTNLVYLQAVVKETLRLYPALPLSAPHQAMEDCTVAGFHVPAGTRLLVNLWKLHRDPAVWRDPLEFKPERFLEDHANVDYKGNSFEYMPFGSGRRACPGISFGVLVVHLTLARLLHGFELETASGGAVDMSESPGLTIPKATPLEVKLAPRLAKELYL